MTRETLENSFLYGANAVFIEELYQRYRLNPASVDASWQKFFSGLGDAVSQKPSWDEAPSAVIGQADPDAATATKDKKPEAPGSAPVCAW